MGFLRLFLALSVVVGHTTPLFGLQLMPPDTAVRLFFIISGFYMSLVLSGKYEGAGRVRTFYTNRLLRLFPGYLLAIAVTAAVEIAAYAYPGGGYGAKMIVGEIDAHLHGGGSLDAWSLALLALPNLFLFGSDIVFLFHRAPDLGWFLTLGLDPGIPTATRMGSYLLIAPAWSIGMELWFYLMIPFLVRWRIAALAALMAASLALHAWMDFHVAWSAYFFFPANLGFFLAGTIGHKLWTATRAGAKVPPAAIVAIGGGTLALLAFREFIPFFRNYSALIALVAALGVPFVFAWSKSSAWDRALGNLSYPVYLFHAAVLAFAANFLHTEASWVVIAITLAIALAVSRLVEEPLERYRARRAAARSAAFVPPSLSTPRIEPWMSRS
jgi:peptidoglycan/LPS O-acetylase OafA/YrhL